MRYIASLHLDSLAAFELHLSSYPVSSQAFEKITDTQPDDASDICASATGNSASRAASDSQDFGHLTTASGLSLIAALFW